MANRTRKNKLLLYLSDDEKIILDEKWKLSGLSSRSAFIRMLIIYGYVLSAIGNNVNQIVRRCQKTGNTYEEDIKAIKDLMEKTWRTQECMLSKQPLENQ